ncbi:MAG TPA: S8 family peptidase [Solirubrobacteraceae bacterium]|nr:S8 family peptidase [Solirubrobacteraceae bacterium]
MRPLSTIRAATTAVAIALIAAPVAHASSIYGPAMSAAQIRSLQGQGVQEIVVDRKPGVTAAQQAAVRANAGVSYVGPGPLPGTEIDRAPAGGLAAAVAALAHDPQVRYAEPNGEVHAAGVPNDPGFGQQWGLSNTGQSVLGTRGTAGDDIGAVYAWAHSTGANVTVAEVDSGVDYTAPDLQGQLINGWDYLNGNNDPQDQFGHGTHVAGIIAALQNNGTGVSGVAPAAKVMPLRVLDATGSGTDVDVAQAFNDAGNDGVAIVNASLGSTAPSQAIEQAIQAHPNTLYVVAAGNEGTNNDDPSSPFYPCDAPEPNVICVGASDQNDQPAWFSDYGATSVDLFAPGVSILSTYPGGYAYDDGTSMATPMVSGTLALMLSRNPSLGATALKSALLASVDQAPQLAGLAVSGGELDAAAAVATAGGDGPYAAPGLRERPEVVGALTVGSTLTVNPGSWSRLPTGYAYQWERCMFGICLPLPGATGASYALTGADDGAAFEVMVTASNAAGSAQASSAITAAVGQPGSTPATDQPPAAGSGSSTPPASTRNNPTHTTRAPAHPARLSHVALAGKRGTPRGQTLVFTLSARTRVQLTLARGGRNVLRLTLSAHRGQNRFSLTSFLHGRHLAPQRYTLTVRAGSRTVTLKLTA